MISMPILIYRDESGLSLNILEISAAIGIPMPDAQVSLYCVMQV